MTINPKFFIFIIDSHEDMIPVFLEPLGLTRDIDHYLTWEGGYGILPGNPEMIGHEKLLVFCDTFHGSTQKSIEYGKWIKQENPAARIIFRSANGGENPNLWVFDESMTKDREFIVKEIESFMK